MATELFTTVGTWVVITTALNARPATTGLHSHASTRYPRPLPTSTRSNHSGVAMSTSGGMKYDSSMCCNMCAE